jgi:hypothetical protein
MFNVIDKNGVVIGQMPSWIGLLKSGEIYDICIILKGDLTGAREIKIASK